MGKKGKEKVRGPEYYCWCIARIDHAYLERVYTDLHKDELFVEVEPYIPTIKILKKTFKGQQHFENVPLMFNYGFMKIPRHQAIIPAFLDKLQKRVNCIYSWVKDPVKRVEKYYEGEPITDMHIHIATATQAQIDEVIKASYYSTFYSVDDIDRLKPGEIIMLKTYPFEDVLATVIEVHVKKHKVEVEIDMLDAKRKVMVSFENVIYTVYHNKGYDDSISVVGSLDAMAEAGTLDKKLYNKSLKDAK